METCDRGPFAIPTILEAEQTLDQVVDDYSRRGDGKRAVLSWIQIKGLLRLLRRKGLLNDEENLDNLDLPERGRLDLTERRVEKL
jgi:hypothetical protein